MRLSPVHPPAAALFAAATFAAAPLAAQSAERYTLRGRDVAVYAPVGRVQVVAGGGRDVVVEVARGGRDGRDLRVATDDVNGRPALRVIVPDRDVVYPAMGDGGRTTLRVRDDGTFGTDGDRDDTRELRISGRGRGVEAWADLVVRVPEGSRLVLRTGVGNASAADLTADLDIGTSAADVTVDRARGRLSVGAGSGRVRVRDARGDEVRVGVGSGEVEVRGVHAERLSVGSGSGDVVGGDLEGGELKLGTGSGELRLSRVRTRRLEAGSGSGRLDLELAAGLDEARLSTGSGGVTLRVPADFGATFDMSTGSGGVSSDLPLQLIRQERHRITGRVGDGRARLRVSSGSGEVRIAAAR